MDVLPIINTTPTMTSLEMVEFINSQRNEGESELRHDDFLRKVPKVLSEAVARNFTGYYKASNGKQNPMYRFPKREACLMAMSYSYDLQAKVFDRMTALEKSAMSALPDFTNPAAAARAWADAVELAQAKTVEVVKVAKQLSIAAPKAEALDRISTSQGGAMCITSAAKVLQMSPSKLFQWMEDNKWIYKREPTGSWIAHQNRLNTGVLEHKVTSIPPSSSSRTNTPRMVTRLLVTPKGIERLAYLTDSEMVIKGTV